MFETKEAFCTIPSLDVRYGMEDYEKGVARWCPGCGGHSILATVQRVCKDMQYPPEKTVAVSGIGCSSRFPHYMGTYGFHGLHGRAFPVASGIKFRRPDLNIFVVTGDGVLSQLGTQRDQEIASVTDQREIAKNGIMTVKQIRYRPSHHAQNGQHGHDLPKHVHVLC